jgi:biopolymer transport protein ExbD
MRERPHEILVAVAADGRYAVNGVAIDGRGVDRLQAAMASAARGRPDSIVIVSADALAVHQSVVNVLDAARRAGLTRLTYAAQSPGAPTR